MSHSNVIRASSLSQSQDHVPDLVVSLASTNCNTPSGKDNNDFTLETVVSNSPPLKRGEAWHFIIVNFTQCGSEVISQYCFHTSTKGW